jgi:hypothetical protein
LSLFAGTLACIYAPSATLVGAFLGMILFQANVHAKMSDDEKKITMVASICFDALVAGITLATGTMSGLVAFFAGYDGLLGLATPLYALVK